MFGKWCMLCGRYLSCLHVLTLHFTGGVGKREDGKWDCGVVIGIKKVKIEKGRFIRKSINFSEMSGFKLRNKNIMCFFMSVQFNTNVYIFLKNFFRPFTDKFVHPYIQNLIYQLARWAPDALLGELFLNAHSSSANL